MTEAELRIERQKLVRRQWAIASELNSIPPTPVPPGYSSFTQARIDGLHREAEENAQTIQAIDAELALV